MGSDFFVSDPGAWPRFLYLLGDNVYFFGETEQYYSQFYAPYRSYPAPIFAIAGNHDGDVSTQMQQEGIPSLNGFMRNFCAPKGIVTPESADATRQAMFQPNVYWTLEAPFLTIVGLYTNVPAGGALDKTQVDWLVKELRTAPADKALIVTMHQPVYSLDTHHSGSAVMGATLDRAIDRSGRIPDLVLSAHVHNYQRFTRTLRGYEVPYIIAGAGVYWHLHRVASIGGHRIETPWRVPAQELSVESFTDDGYGYLRLDVTPDHIEGSYIVASPASPAQSASSSAATSPTSQPFDMFSLDLRSHRVSLLSGNPRKLAGARILWITVETTETEYETGRLAGLGASVVESASLDDAQTRLRDERFDIEVVVAAQMDGPSGGHAQAERLSDVSPYTPIIIYSVPTEAPNAAEPLGGRFALATSLEDVIRLAQQARQTA
jgi:hypothetical protein